LGVLDGKHALVTGGGSGVGAAIARALSEAGAVVTVAGRRRGPLENIAARLPSSFAVEADVTDEASVESLYRAAQAACGPVDIVVANAGAAASELFATTERDLWERMIAVNLTGVYLTWRYGLIQMADRGWGRLISVASTAGLKGYGYVAAYCAAKHGVVGLTRAVALETAKTGITANALCPGFTETAMLQESIANIAAKTGQTEPAARAALAASNPQGRFIQPEEVAQAALWLCGPGSDAVTGQAISISGGETW
jgi:NAD(P)-dependent dehydrogenase (short-subunit alcohol dehydrogenase family)